MTFKKAKGKDIIPKYGIEKEAYNQSCQDPETTIDNP